MPTKSNNGFPYFRKVSKYFGQQTLWRKKFIMYRIFKLSKVDTASDPSGIKYEPRDTVKMISYLSSVYRIGKWDTHLGLASWDGSSIRTEIYPDTFEGTLFESYK